MQVLRTRVPALAGTAALAATAALAVGPATAGAVCLPAGVAIQSPAPTAPATAAIVAGTTNVVATATSSGLPAPTAAIRILDGANVPVGPDQPATVGAPDADTYPVTAAVNTRTLPADGTYKLVVVASNGCDPAGTAQVDLKVDNTPPTLSFTSGPADGAVLADPLSAAFAFASAPDLTGPVTFQCAYDAAAPASCSSPAPPVQLGAGAHSFRVVGTDGAGNSSGISRAFTVAAPPTVPVSPSSSSDTPAPKPSCRVPRLRGLTLAAAKTKLRKANCRVGRVSKPPRRILSLRINRGQRLVVQRQSLRAGTRRANNYPIGIALVPKRDLKLG